MKRCTLCGTEAEDLCHIPIYVIGSEGAVVCCDCRMALTATANAIKLASSKARMQGYKAAKKVQEAKAQQT